VQAVEPGFRGGLVPRPPLRERLLAWRAAALLPLRRLLSGGVHVPEPVKRALAAPVARLSPLGLPRLRWLTKARTVRGYGVGIRERPLDVLRYVLLDPELDNFTYPLANERELAAFVGQALGIPESQVQGYFEEVRRDPELTAGLRKASGRRLDRKRTVHFGRRLGWYAAVRALAPAVVVETGIHEGLGSLLLLRALERNAEQGVDGRLISVDIDPGAGWLVAPHLRGRWQPIFASTFDALEPALDGLEVGVMIHDSDHTYDCERFEFETAAAHAAPVVALISDNAHGDTALPDVAKSLGVEYRLFLERPKNHFYPGAGLGLSILRREDRG
jgi:hypothetical protein